MHSSKGFFYFHNLKEEDIREEEEEMADITEYYVNIKFSLNC